MIWQSLFRRRRLEADLTDELRSYVELLTDENLKAGMAPDVARRQALLSLGGIEQVKEEVRSAWFSSVIDGIQQDVRHTYRSMKSSAGSTGLAIAMLAIGIGAATSIFAIFYSVLLRPSAFPHPEKLVQIWETRVSKGWQRSAFTEANFWDVRSRSRSFVELTAVAKTDGNLTGEGTPEHVKVARVSAGFFRVLKMNLTAGRGFLPDDQEVAVLQNSFWRTHFNADPHVIGRTLRLEGHSYSIVGVAPPGDPWLNEAALFVPLPFQVNADRRAFQLSVIGRLKEQVTLASAAADLERVCYGLAEQYPREDAGIGIQLATASVWGASPAVRRALTVFLVAVGCLLLIACVNLANLLLAKSTVRAREMTIRTALGASTGRIARLILGESLAQCLLGAGLGVLLAEASLHLLRAADIPGIPRIGNANLNGWVLVFSVLVACVTGVLAGIAPVHQVSGRSLVSALRHGDRSQTGSRSQMRLRNLLVSAEVALSLVLLIGAGLLLRSFNQLAHVERGFQSDNRLLFSLDLPASYDSDRIGLTTRRLLTTLRAQPQILAAAAVNTRPLSEWDPGMGIVPASATVSTGANVPWASWRVVSSNYFRTMGVPLLRGREFADQEIRIDVRPIVVTRSLADTLWPGQNPIGQHALLWTGQSNRLAEVIGEAGDVRERGLGSDPTPLVFMPLGTSLSSPVTFVLHTAGNPLNYVSQVRTLVAGIDPDIPVSDVRTLDSVVDEALGPQRLNMVLMALFAGTALLLALAGIYGVLAYSVAQRTPEIAVRLVLGATKGSVLGYVMGQGMRPVFIGIATGLALAFVLSRFLTAILFQVQTIDPLTYGAVILLMGFTAAVSCIVPALRATRVAPAIAMRVD